MRAAGFACVGALAVAFAGLNLQSRQAAGIAPAPLDAAPTAAPATDTPTMEPPRADVVRRPAPPSNGRRGRRRDRFVFDNLPSPEQWTPPDGPVRIALQAGHWKAAEAPDELAGLRANGAYGGGKAEWEVNLEIARHAAELLEGMGYEVDVLPATVPPLYRAHLFISIHADASADARATGYRVAAPRRDATGRARDFVQLLERTYGEATGLRRIPTLTRRMENYYAFNFSRYDHALHPLTIGVIIETGFITSVADRRLIMGEPERVARGIVEAVRAFPVTPPPSATEGP